MLACPDDSKTAIPLYDFSISPIPANPIRANHFQPPLAWFDVTPIVANRDAATLLAGGAVFGFACGIDTAILIYAVAGKELNFLALGCGLALAAMVGVHLFANCRLPGKIRENRR